MGTEGNNQTAGASVEWLKAILETEQHRVISLADAQEIAYDLITFYELLAEGSDEY